MKIAVIGAGVIGITTAYELTADGHEVTVFEKNAAAAEGCSFANAGVISTGLILPGSMPPWPANGFSAFFKNQDKIQWHSRASIQQWKWLWNWRHAYRHPDFMRHCSDLHALMAYSQQRMQNISATSGLEFERQTGHLLLCLHEREMHQTNAHIAWLKELGTNAHAVSNEEVHKIEPALNIATKLTGAWHFPSDETANSRQLSLQLKNEAIRMGATFHFSTEITKLTPGSNPSVTLQGGETSQSFDAMVVCAGNASNQIFTTTGHRLPMATIHSYSLTAAIREPLNAPRGAVVDASSGCVVARIGNRIRITHGASLGDTTEYRNKESIEKMYRVLQDFFPSAVNFSSGIQIWKGAQPTVRDGLPYLGLSSANGIWVNTGHGANGWGMSFGAARVLADLIKGTTPEIDVDCMQASRKFT